MRGPPWSKMPKVSVGPPFAIPRCVTESRGGGDRNSPALGVSSFGRAGLASRSRRPSRTAGNDRAATPSPTCDAEKRFFRPQRPATRSYRGHLAIMPRMARSSLARRPRYAVRRRGREGRGPLRQRDVGCGMRVIARSGSVGGTTDTGCRVRLRVFCGQPSQVVCMLGRVACAPIAISGIPVQTVPQYGQP